MNKPVLQPISYLSTLTKLASAISLSLFSSSLWAVVLDNQTLTITSATPVDDYQLNNQSVLTVDGAQTLAIRASNSVLNILSGTVVAANNGISLLDSQASIANARVSSTSGTGLLLAHGTGGAGSRATVSNSQISGSAVGAQATAGSLLTLIDSQVVGTATNSVGMRFFSGSAQATGSSITGESAGVQIFREGSRPEISVLTLDNSVVTGVSGPAIRLMTGVSAIINVENGSRLSAGDGVLLDMAGNSNADVNVRASNLEGNILVAETASATLNVDNASLVGDINSNGNTTANFTQSTFTGAVNVGSNATVNLALDQARMVGDVIVQQGGNASLGLNNGAQLTGTVNAATGSTVNLALDQARMAGDVIVQQDGNASLRLNNGAQLTGTVNAATGSTVNLALNQASMVGDVLAEQGSITTVVLNNNAQLTGKLANVQQLEINSGSAWTMTGDSTLGNLAMSNGRVTMGDNATFQRLNVTNLSGNGDFHMASDFATGASDFINVTGTSSGNHGLLVASSGSEAGVESVQLVQTADGGAQFHLLNDRGQVDVGAYSYQLAAKDNGWYLDQETRTISPGTRAVMALFNSPITVAYGEQASLRSRMGELRYSQGRSAGVWARAYGNQYNIADASSGVGYQQNQRGLSLGADMRVGESDWLVGVLAGSSRSDLNLSYGTSGSIDSYYLGGYATWLDSETGYYVDTVLKYNRYQNNAKVGLSDGTRAKGDYDTHGMSASVEAGKHIKLNDGVFIEPFAKVDVATVAGKDFSLDNSMRAEGDSSQSLLGKAGVTLGKTIELGADSMVQPYVKAAFAHEFAQRNEVQVNNNVFNNDLSGSRAELGAGVVLSLSKQFQVHVDVDYMNGKNIEQPYGVNVGLRYAF